MPGVTEILLLVLTITLSAGRNILSKFVSKTAFGKKSFYRFQTCIFSAGSIALALFADYTVPSPLTVGLAVTYAAFLILAQWCYTIALGRISVSICSTIYSLGFIIPTLSGVVIWNESFTVFDSLGLCCVVAAIVLSGQKGKTVTEQSASKVFFITLVIAMLSSGGLGLIQKTQQALPHSEEKSMFVLIAFIIAALVSFIFSVFSKKDEETPKNKQFVVAILTGACFGICNLLNTTLAGKLDSALFFPIQNISVILLTIVFSYIITKERFTKKSAVTFLLGVAAMVLLNCY